MGGSSLALTSRQGSNATTVLRYGSEKYDVPQGLDGGFLSAFPGKSKEALCNARLDSPVLATPRAISLF